jgi:hypothetical protein
MLSHDILSGIISSRSVRRPQVWDKNGDFAVSDVRISPLMR